MSKKFEHYDDVIESCAALRTLSAARNITRLYGDALKPLGITINQFTLLITIGRLRPDSISNINEWLNIDRTSLTRNLKPLEAAGFVSRFEEGTKRKRRIELTKKGNEILTRAYPLWKKVQAQVESEFDQSEFDFVIASLDKLRDLTISK